MLFSGYDANGEAGIWAVPFPAGGRPELVLRYDDPNRRAYGPYWTPGRDRVFVVLQEAQSPEVPLLERLKFMAIFSSNLDEYFKVRVATLRRFLRI